jgi:hypothetical protein
LIRRLVLLSSLLCPFLLSGCNAGAIALDAFSQRALASTTLTGTLTNPTTHAKVGYLTWLELLQDGSLQGRLNFDLIQDKDVSFDVTTAPASGAYSLTINPKPAVAEGTYVVFAWDDTNGDGLYQGDQGERRAPEVYRVRGQAGAQGAWTVEKFVFTDQKLSIQYVDPSKGLNFSF